MQPGLGSINLINIRTAAAFGLRIIGNTVVCESVRGAQTGSLLVDVIQQWVSFS